MGDALFPTAPLAAPLDHTYLRIDPTGREGNVRHMIEKLDLLLDIAAVGGVAVAFLLGTFSPTGAGPGDVEKPPAVATFAGGCFWCMEPTFVGIDGVISATVGYTGGRTRNPTYEEVCSGTTGHAEAIRIEYDPSKVSYAALLDVFWRNIDPTTPNRQFCDVGTQYRTAIFVQDDSQKRLAEETKAELERRLEHVISTEIVPASEFYPAEDYHQEFYKKSPLQYQSYRMGCGRDARLEKLWGKQPKHN